MNQWPQNKAYLWERYPFLRLLLPLVVGIVAYPWHQWNRSFLFSCVFILVVCLSLFVYATKRQKQLLSSIGFHAFFFFAAYALCYLSDDRNHPKRFENYRGSADSYIAVLTQQPTEKNKTWKLEVNVTGFNRYDKKYKTIGNAFVYVYKYPSPPSLNEGDTILIPNEWLPITNSGNPFEFDYANYCAFNGIYKQQFLSAQDITILHFATEHDLSWVRKAHYWCKRQLEWYIQDAATLGLLEAMLIGDKAELNPELKQAYADTGIVHVIAISGAHIGIFFVITLLLFSWVTHNKYRWLKYLAALPLIWAYVLIAGAPASAIRAATMFSILAIGFAMQKNPNGINQLLATAFILLCVDPKLLFNIGFQLSFTAVLSIFIFYKPIFKWLSPRNRIVRSLWSAIAVSIAAEILVAPLVIYYFHLFPLQFVVTNVLAYLFMGAILVVGMLIIAVSSFTSVASILGKGIILLSTLFNKIVYQLQGLNFNSFHRLTLTSTELILVYIFIIIISIFLFRKSKIALYLSIITIAFLLPSFIYKHYQTQQQEILVVYNISGDSYTEFIKGNIAQVVHRKQPPKHTTEQYVLKPAHINWHISSIDTNGLNNHLIQVGSKTAYVYMGELAEVDVDYLILTERQLKKELSELKEAFSPNIIVLGNSCSKATKSYIKHECQLLGISVYDVETNGAFILSNH